MPDARTISMRCGNPACKIRLRIVAAQTSKTVRCPRCKLKQATPSSPVPQAPACRELVEPVRQAHGKPAARRAHTPAAHGPTTPPENGRFYEARSVVRRAWAPAVLGIGAGLLVFALLANLGIPKESPNASASHPPERDARERARAALLAEALTTASQDLKAAQAFPAPAPSPIETPVPTQAPPLHELEAALAEALAAQRGHEILRVLPQLLAADLATAGSVLETVRVLRAGPGAFGLSEMALHRFLLSRAALPVLDEGLARVDLDRATRELCADAIALQEAPEAGPIFARRLAAETDPRVLVRMLLALDGRAEARAWDAARRAIKGEHLSEEARWTAVETLAHLEASQAGAILRELLDATQDPGARARLEPLAKAAGAAAEASGVLVLRVEPLPEEAALPEEMRKLLDLDLRPGDIVLEAASRPCASSQALREALRHVDAEGAVRLKILRGGQTIELQTTAQQLAMSLSRVTTRQVGKADMASPPPPGPAQF